LVFTQNTDNHPAVASWTVLKEGHGVGRN